MPQPPDPDRYSELEKTIHDVVARLCRQLRRANLRDDLLQEGWVHALQAVDRHDPAVGPLRPYLQSILIKNLGRFVQRSSSALTLSKGEATNPQRTEHHVADDGWHNFYRDDRTPERLLLQRERAVMVRRAVNQVATKVRQDVRCLPYCERILLAGYLRGGRAGHQADVIGLPRELAGRVQFRLSERMRTVRMPPGQARAILQTLKMEDPT